MKILGITQARISSNRLPKKILKKINGESLLEIHLKRLKKSKYLSKIKIATTNEKESDLIINIGKDLGIDSYKGSLNNVLKRFYFTALDENPLWVARFTSDCPLNDSNLFDKVINKAIRYDFDYYSTSLKPSLPDGIGVEVFKFSALEKAYKNAILKSELEHVTPFIWKNSSFMGGKIFTSGCYINNIDYSNIRLTVDNYNDYKVIERIIYSLGTKRNWEDYAKFYLNNENLNKLNKDTLRNEGYINSIKKDK